MTLPTSGPFTRTTGNGDSFYRRQITMGQKPPYDLRLGYEMRTITRTARVGTEPYRADQVPYVVPGIDAAVDNKAYKNLVNQCGPSSDLGASLAESRQSLDMIATRAGQLFRFTRALRRGDFVGAGQQIGVIEKRRPPKGWRNQPADKKVASGYLEYGLGWVPLARDIGDSIEVLQNPIRDKVVRGYAKGTYTWRTGNPSYKGTRVSDYEALMKVMMIANIRVSNPNLNLARQMGFVNPAAVAWELVPFSFIADWFVNVGDVINSMTDFAGLTVSQPMTTRVYHNSQYHWWVPYGTGPITMSSRYTTCYMKRGGGLPPPRLAFSTQRFGVKQASYALALLIQALR